MKISCTPAKDAKNLADHGFSLNVCKEFPPESILLPTYPGTDVVRFKLIGMTRHGLLCAIITPRPPVVHVISLRRANRSETRKYEAAQIRHA